MEAKLLNHFNSQNEYDPVYPGENWFYYWKTSPTLWENKLETLKSNVPIFVPIFWGFHSEYEDAVDFGSIKPEANLQRLHEIATRMGRHLVFIVPVMPMPFLPNGGVPSYVARNNSHDENGMTLCVIDNESRLNKIYSFFEPKVFHAYKKFMWNLGQYFSENAISSHVYGAECFRNENGCAISYICDFSPTFDRGFSRFISQQNEGGTISSIQQEYSKKLEYIQLIKELYISCARESLSVHWSGTIPFTFLGGSTSNVFSRSSDIWEFSGNYFNDIVDIVTSDKMPSSVLLPYEVKEGVLQRALDDYISPSYIHRSMKYSLFEDEVESSLSPLFFFEIFNFSEEIITDINLLNNNGLITFLDSNFKSTYVFKDELEFSEENFISGNKVFYFWGVQNNPSCLKDVFKIFLNGGKVLLDSAQFGLDVLKKLETYFLENNLQKESVSYLTQIDHVSLGDGQINIFNSEKLKDFSSMRKIAFWERLVDFLNVKHLEIEADSDVALFWKKRLSTPLELNYEEVRRLSIFNPTSYKKKVRIITKKNFALLRVLSENHVTVKTSPIGIDLEVLPGGSVSFDFGYFE
jgi:hypothetical protein